MRNQLLILALFITVIIFSCTPAQSVSGTYTGSYSGSNMPNTSGSATVIISENGTDKVNIAIQSSGNPEYTASNVTVNRINIFGIVYYDLSLYVYPWTLNGDMYEASGELNFTLSNDTSSFYFSFTGMK